jgi:aspartate racemase
MSRIGVFGGMGPAATVDFMEKLVQLTPARRDQDHLPVVVASLPHVHDRSRAILGQGPTPLDQLLQGIDFLNGCDVGVVAIPCNSSHHWYDELSARSKSPLLHIARSCVAAMDPASLRRVAVFATRGALSSGFYQRSLEERGIEHLVPPGDGAQQRVDDCIRQVKGGDPAEAGRSLAAALAWARSEGAHGVIMGCTEIPIAVRHAPATDLHLVDSSLELARATVNYALERGWNRPGWDS